jgi:hypothetical protein
VNAQTKPSVLAITQLLDGSLQYRNQVSLRGVALGCVEYRVVREPVVDSKQWLAIDADFQNVEYVFHCRCYSNLLWHSIM